MKTSIVLGLGYGDEGKGLTTQYLCRQSQSPLVLRFSGGHQAGHTVVTPSGTRHVFSNFGAGSLQGTPTYWSRYCSFYPPAFFREWEALDQLNIRPRISVDALAQVTTPYDVYANQVREKARGHGSCGVGFGATMARNQTPHKFYVQDLRYPAVVSQRLKAIATYYSRQLGEPDLESRLAPAVADFRKIIPQVLSKIRIVSGPGFFSDLKEYDHLIFEGSQGILLDMDHGFFPHVTYAHTTSRNALDLIRKFGLEEKRPAELYYVTRAYQTRHGNGFLSNEKRELSYRPNPRETNQTNEWQGAQRVSPLDLDMLDYALEADQNYSGNRPRHLVMTCLDQIDGPILATRADQLQAFSSTVSLSAELHLRFHSLLESYSEVAEDMVLRKRILAA